MLILISSILFLWFNKYCKPLSAVLLILQKIKIKAKLLNQKKVGHLKKNNVHINYGLDRYKQKVSMIKQTNKKHVQHNKKKTTKN